MYTLQSILNWNQDLFSGINVDIFNHLINTEEKIPSIVQDTLVSNIILRCGLLQPVYGEPNLLQSQIKLWWQSNYYNFFQMWRGMHLEYNPIENYNRFEDSKRKLDYDDTTEDSGSDTSTNSGNDVSTDSQSDTTEEQVSAYNVSTYQPKTETTIRYGKQNTLQHGRKTTLQYGKSNKYTGHDTDEYHAHTHGNIGVTTNQQMLQQELELRQKSVYDMIADNFESHICITVY